MTFFKFDKTRNLPGKMLMNLSSTMAISLSIWIIFSQERERTKCLAAAITLHYLWLVTFFWMAAIGVDTWRQFKLNALITDQSTIKSLYYTYCSVSWGSPVIIVVTSVALTYTQPNLKFSYGERQLCWIDDLTQLFITFLVPIIIIVLMNFFLFIATIVNIVKLRNVSAHARGKRPCDMVPFLKLPVILGVSWLLGVIGIVYNHRGLWIIFDFVNSSQGVLIFIVFFASKSKRALYGWVKHSNVDDSHTTKKSGVK
jgi:hypothetical protein